MSQLEFPPEEMRKMGYQVIDMLVDHLTNLPDKSAAKTISREEIEKMISVSFSEEPMAFDQALSILQEHVFANMFNVSHPKFFAYIPGPGNFISVLAETLAAGYNVFEGTWLAAAGPSQIEWDTIEFLCQQLGYPKTSGGICVSGGSVANLTALAAARKALLDDKIQQATVYYSDQTHTATDRALKVLGFGSDNIRRLDCDNNFMLPMTALEKAVAKDRENGYRPFCVIANSGTTNTGAVDPLPQLGKFCSANNMWFHVDGAYGASAILSSQGKELLKGIELADSIALDPHKWLFQPFEIGCTLLKDFQLLKNAFQILPEFLQDAAQSGREINFCDYGIQLSRSFRALKLWLSFKVFGLKAFREAIAKGFSLARFAEKAVADRDKLQLVTSAQMAIITFRYFRKNMDKKVLNEINNAIVKKLVAQGFAMLSSTSLRGQTVLRLCPINPRTEEKDIVDTLDKIIDYGEDLKAG